MVELVTQFNCRRFLIDERAVDKTINPYDLTKCVENTANEPKRWMRAAIIYTPENLSKHGDWSIMSNTGYGLLGGATANLSLQYQQTNAQSVSDLNGSSEVFGGSVGFFTSERIVGNGYTGFGVGASLGPDAGGSAHYGYDYGGTAYTTASPSGLRSSYNSYNGYGTRK